MISFLVLTLFHFIILGHTVDEVLFRTHVPKQFSAPNLPELNRSQVHAVRHALQRPLSLIQGKNLNCQKMAGTYKSSNNLLFFKRN